MTIKELIKRISKCILIIRDEDAQSLVDNEQPYSDSFYYLISCLLISTLIVTLRIILQFGKNPLTAFGNSLFVHFEYLFVFYLCAILSSYLWKVNQKTSIQSFIYLTTGFNIFLGIPFLPWIMLLIILLNMGKFRLYSRWFPWSNKIPGLPFVALFFFEFILFQQIGVY